MSDWTICRFAPLDVVVSADARPLDVGGFGLVGDLTPGAIAGSLRTLILKRAGFRSVNGRFEPPPGEAEKTRADEAARVAGFSPEGAAPLNPALECFGPLYANARGTVLLPAPGSALRLSGTSQLIALAPSHDEHVIADAGLDACTMVWPDRWPREGQSLDPDARWWPLAKVAEWLCRSGLHHATPADRATLEAGAQVTAEAIVADESDAGSATPLSHGERRVGHARDDGRRVPEDGALFSRGVRRFVQDVQGASGTRLRSAGYAALTRGGETWLSPGSTEMVRLGGDGHLAHASFASATPTLDAAAALLRVVERALEQGATGVQMYLATPALFEGAWRPSAIDASALRLRAGAVARPQVIAGWDLRLRQPKPVQRAAGGGSVYFFEVVDRARALDVIRRHHLNQPVGDVAGAGLGFGCALFGLWDPGKAS